MRYFLQETVVEKCPEPCVEQSKLMCSLVRSKRRKALSQEGVTTYKILIGNIYRLSEASFIEAAGVDNLIPGAYFFYTQKLSSRHEYHSDDVKLGSLSG